jgi:hypothetical protein
MRSFIAALRTLVLPFGATTGRRIVLDGIQGLIVIFDAGNNERIIIGESGDSIELITGTVGEATGGQLKAVGVNAGQPDAQAELEIISPSLAAPDNKVAAIILTSEADDGVEQPSIFMDAATVTFSPTTVADGIRVELLGTLTASARLHVGGGTAFPSIDMFQGVVDIESGGDVQIDDRSLPRGVLELAQSTANVGPTVAAAELTLLSVTATLLANRRYRLHAHLRSVAHTIDTDAFVTRFKEGATTLNEFSYGASGQTGGAEPAAEKRGEEFIHYIDGTTAGSHTYNFVLVRLIGTGTATAEAGATFPMQFVIEDVGPNTNVT